MMKRHHLVLVGVLLAAVLLPAAATADPPFGTHTQTLLASGLQGGMGSAVGPDGALYVTEPAAGRISRVDPRTGQVTTFADGLPKQNPTIGLGGVMDVVFEGQTAYALTTIVGPDVGGTGTTGIYRIDGPHSSHPIADIGAFAIAHPPSTGFMVPSGVQYSIDLYRGDFLVTDGHHNRVYQVSHNGSISVLRSFDDIVPTGLAVRGNRVYMAEAGPVPHLPANGKIVTFDDRTPGTSLVAAGAPLLVDVEFGPGNTLFAAAQGHWDNAGGPGTPAEPDTGELVAANDNGTFTVLASHLDRPTSLEVIGNTAYVVTLDGEVWKIDHLVGNGH